MGLLLVSLGGQVWYLSQQVGRPVVYVHRGHAGTWVHVDRPSAGVCSGGPATWVCMGRLGSWIQRANQDPGTTGVGLAFELTSLSFSHGERVSLCVLGCLGLGRSDESSMNLSFLLPSCIFSNFSASHRCYNTLPGILGSCKIIFACG